MTRNPSSRIAACLGATLFPLACLLAVLASGPSAAQVPDSISVGAIRWDAWFDGAGDQAVLEQPAWTHRAPFFSRRDASGKLVLDGDKEFVLHAEVAYARAIGLDYFIFGYYPETGSWKRAPRRSQKLNRALSSYLQLPDRMGVKFAISLNQFFPAEDIADIAVSLGALAAHPDHVRSQTGTVPIFILGHDGLDWSRFFGTDEKAREAVAAIRAAVRASTGRDVTFVIMTYDPASGAAAARRYGLDMASTYSSFAPGQGAAEQDPRTCLAHGRALWDRARREGFPYAPNITIGWDERPRKAHEPSAGTKPQGPWCKPPAPSALSGQFAAAARFIEETQGAAPFRTVVIYAWNEFTEGGWIAPTLGSAPDWLAGFRSAIGRNRTLPPVQLAWPENASADTCWVRTGAQEASRRGATCRDPLQEAAAWPCPPGQTVTGSSIRAATGLEALLHDGGWRTQTCR